MALHREDVEQCRGAILRGGKERKMYLSLFFLLVDGRRGFLRQILSLFPRNYWG